MNNLTYSEVQTYFETLANAHNDINDFSHFIISGQPFPLAFLETFLADLRNIKPPFLLLQHYVASYADNNADTWLKNAEGAFLIMDKLPNQKDATIKAKLNSTEQIAEEIIAYMLQDFKSTTNVPKAFLDLNDFQIEAIGEISSYIGVRVDFTINQSARDRLTYNASKFTF